MTAVPATSVDLEACEAISAIEAASSSAAAAAEETEFAACSARGAVELVGGAVELAGGAAQGAERLVSGLLEALDEIVDHGGAAVAGLDLGDLLGGEAFALDGVVAEDQDGAGHLAEFVGRIRRGDLDGGVAAGEFAHRHGDAADLPGHGAAEDHGDQATEEHHADDDADDQHHGRGLGLEARLVGAGPAVVGGGDEDVGLLVEGGEELVELLDGLLHRAGALDIGIERRPVDLAGLQELGLGGGGDDRAVHLVDELGAGLAEGLEVGVETAQHEVLLVPAHLQDLLEDAGAVVEIGGDAAGLDLELLHRLVHAAGEARGLVGAQRLDRDADEVEGGGGLAELLQRLLDLGLERGGRRPAAGLAEGHHGLHAGAGEIGGRRVGVPLGKVEGGEAQVADARPDAGGIRREARRIVIGLEGAGRRPLAVPGGAAGCENPDDRNDGEKSDPQANGHCGHASSHLFEALWRAVPQYCPRHLNE